MRSARPIPDPCVTPSAVWRILTGGMVAAVCLRLGAVLGSGPARPAWPCCCSGGVPRRDRVLEGSALGAARGGRGHGVSAWASSWSADWSIVDTARLRVDDALDAVLVAGALMCGLAGWRWGARSSPDSRGSRSSYLGRLPQGRALWLLAGAVLTGLVAVAPMTAAGALASSAPPSSPSSGSPPCTRRATSIRSTSGSSKTSKARPARRALPLAGHGGRTRHGPVPLVVLAWGVGRAGPGARHRDRAARAVARHAPALRPRGPALGGADAAGALLVVLALAVERALRRARGESAGFTADPLFSDERRQQILQTVPVVAAFTPPAPMAAQDARLHRRGGAIRRRRRAGEVLMRRCRRHRVAMVRWGSGALPTPAVFGNPSATLTETGGAHTVAAGVCSGRAAIRSWPHARPGKIASAPPASRPAPPRAGSGRTKARARAHRLPNAARSPTPGGAGRRARPTGRASGTGCAGRPRDPPRPGRSRSSPRRDSPRTRRG